MFQGQELRFQSERTMFEEDEDGSYSLFRFPEGAEVVFTGNIGVYLQGHTSKFPKTISGSHPAIGIEVLYKHKKHIIDPAHVILADFEKILADSLPILS